MADDSNQKIRAGFGRLAVTVAVITAFDDGKPHGCTGMAWAEHPAPPLLLTTLRASGRTRELVEAAGRFGVSVLSEEQHAYAAKFAAREPAPGGRFSGVPFSPGPVYGLPLLDEAVASFECEVKDIHSFGGHEIVVGRVAWASATGPRRPLVHYAGQLWGLREAGA